MMAHLFLLQLWLTAAPAPQPSPSSAPRVVLGAVSLQVPVVYQRRTRSGSYRFDSPRKDAYFVVDVSEVQTAGMEPSVCLDKIIAALGGDAWHRLMLGGFPAAHRSNADTSKSDGLTVRTHTFVGCNGKTTWSLMFHMDEKHADRYEPEVVALAKSLEFVTPASPPERPPADAGAPSRR